MNSLYGKSIESDHDTESHILDKKDQDKFLGSHYDSLLESNYLDEAETKINIKVRKEC